MKILKNPNIQEKFYQGKIIEVIDFLWIIQTAYDESEITGSIDAIEVNNSLKEILSEFYVDVEKVIEGDFFDMDVLFEDIRSLFPFVIHEFNILENEDDDYSIIEYDHFDAVRFNSLLNNNSDPNIYVNHIEGSFKSNAIINDEPKIHIDFEDNKVLIKAKIYGEVELQPLIFNHFSELKTVKRSGDGLVFTFEMPFYQYVESIN